LMIRCCENNRRSDGGRGPRPTCYQVAGRAGGVAGPGLRPLPQGGAQTPCQGVCAGTAGRAATQELLDDRRAGRRPQPRWDAVPAGPGGLGPHGVRDVVRDYVVGHLGDPKRCWSWMRPATSRRVPARLGPNASTPAPLGGSRTPRSRSTWCMPPAAATPSSTGSCMCPTAGRGSPGRLGRR
jgi:hypothetical protein